MPVHPEGSSRDVLVQGLFMTHFRSSGGLAVLAVFVGALHGDFVAITLVFTATWHTLCSAFGNPLIAGTWTDDVRFELRRVPLPVNPLDN